MADEQEDPKTISDALERLWDKGREPKILSTKDIDDLADVLISGARQTGLIVLRGYLGGPGVGDGAGTKKWFRLYGSLEFNEYIDIPEDAAVHIVDLRSPFDRLAGQAVWMKVGTDLIRGRTGVSKESLSNRYVGGDISSSGGGGRGWGGASPSPWCATGSRGWGGASPSPWCADGPRGWGGASPSPWCAG